MMRLQSAAGLLTLIMGLTLALPAHSASIVYSQDPTALTSASVIRSNAVNHPDGSDQDVTAYDNFKLDKSASILKVTWRGSAADKDLAGFTIKIYASKHDPSAQPDTFTTVAMVNISGNAGEKPAGNNLSDYQADLNEPVLLSSGVQYWISIVSKKNGSSTWGWANSMSGDGNTIQSYAEFKILPAPGDRAFSLYGESGSVNKH